MMALLIATVTSLLLAAIMSVIAWRVAGDERRRSDARVNMLAAEIHGHTLAVNPNPFVSQPAPSGDRAFVVVGGGALAIAAAVAVAILIGGDRFTRWADRGMRRAPSASPVVAAAPAALPLELVALGHERVGNRLTVRGVVRHPPSGAAMDQLTAVVVLFTPDDEFIASGRAAVTAVSGGESTFTITVPGITDVAKYRVSFRRDERIIPHLDKRHES